MNGAALEPGFRAASGRIIAALAGRFRDLTGGPLQAAHRRALANAREVAPPWQDRTQAGDSQMSVIHWLEIHWFQLTAAVLLFAFIAFALRQGRKVRPLPPGERPPLRPEDLGGGGST